MKSSIYSEEQNVFVENNDLFTYSNKERKEHLL